jgi:hypothetical protein
MSVFGYWTTYPMSNDNRRPYKKTNFNDSIVVIRLFDVGYVLVYSIHFQFIGYSVGAREHELDLRSAPVVIGVYVLADITQR